MGRYRKSAGTIAHGLGKVPKMVIQLKVQPIDRLLDMFIIME